MRGKSQSLLFKVLIIWATALGILWGIWDIQVCACSGSVGDQGYLSLCLFWPCPSHLPLQWPASGARGDPGGRAAPRVGRAARRGCGSAPARPRRMAGPAARAPTHSCNSATAAAVQVRPHCSLPSPPLLVVNAFCF